MASATPSAGLLVSVIVSEPIESETGSLRDPAFMAGAVVAAVLLSSAFVLVV